MRSDAQTLIAMSDFRQHPTGAPETMDGMNVGTVVLSVHAIPTRRLDEVRVSGKDGHGNQLRPYPASGKEEPLRCCLRNARPNERITLISYAPFEQPSVWREVGPVYIHAEVCAGYHPDGRLPAELALGPRVLRTYRADGTMDYEHNTVVTEQVDLAPIIERLLSQPGVATVHVRTVAPQCFLYAVTAG